MQLFLNGLTVSSGYEYNATGGGYSGGGGYGGGNGGFDPVGGFDSAMGNAGGFMQDGANSGKGSDKKVITFKLYIFFVSSYHFVLKGFKRPSIIDSFVR